MPKSNSKHLIIIIAGVIIILLLLLALLLKDTATTISANALENALQKNLIVKLWEQGDYLYAKGRDSQVYKVLRSSIELSTSNTKADSNQQPTHASQLPALLKSLPIERASSTWLIYLIIALLLGVAGGAFALLQKRSRMAISPMNANMNANLRSNPLESSSAIAPLHSSMRFSDVAGIDEVKAELLEIVDFLKNPHKYQHFHVNMPRGVLLSGAPGVGKTLLAKALAGESGVPFFYQSGASFVEMYVGVGAKRVRELFSRAKASAPCIIFIDEIDAIGKARQSGSHNNERESTLNQLLVEMDGFSDNSGVIVLGATNHIDALDPALLRSGRFDRKLFIELPNKQEREHILSMYLANKPHNLHAHIPEIASQTSGFSGASLATLVNEAALTAIRRGAQGISKQDFDSVYGKIHSGLKRLPLLESHMRDVYAIYQASKLLYALRHNLTPQRFTLFETTLLPYSPHTLRQSELLVRVRFHLIGDRALRVGFGDSFGIFAQDSCDARELIAQGQELGLLQSTQASALEEQIIYDERHVATQGLVEFIKLELDNLCTLAALLLQQERLESIPETPAALEALLQRLRDLQKRELRAGDLKVDSSGESLSEGLLNTHKNLDRLEHLRAYFTPRLF